MSTTPCKVCGKRSSIYRANKKGVWNYFCDKHDPDRPKPEIEDDRFTPGGSPIFY